MDFGGESTVSMLSKVSNSNTYVEIKHSKRLQWMLIIILLILLTSFTKYLFNIIKNDKNDLIQHLNLHSRLQFSAKNPI